MRRATAAVLLVGLAVVAWALASPGRRWARSVNRLALGSDTAQVTTLLGDPPARCPAGGMEHLRDRFPTGTPLPAMEQALDRLQAETAQRWVYPDERGERAGCTPRHGATEIGVDRSGRVRWYVPATGRIPLVLPEGYLPAATGA